MHRRSSLLYASMHKTNPAPCVNLSHKDLDPHSVVVQDEGKFPSQYLLLVIHGEDDPPRR
jgi:hypothetical protein